MMRPTRELKATFLDGKVTRDVSIYVLSDPRTGLVRYVGKTARSIDRRLYEHVCAARNDYRPHSPIMRWIKKLCAENLRPLVCEIELIVGGKSWELREQYWIKRYRAEGASLLNLTDGGDGLHGLVPSASHRQNLSASLRKGSTFQCEICGEEFWRKPREIRLGDCRFCSRKCYLVWQVGKPKVVDPHTTELMILAAAEKRREQTHCKRGHLLSGENLFLTWAGSRGCKQCRRIHKAAYLARAA